MTVIVSDVRFTSASREDREAGLIGWVALTVNRSIRLDGLTLRRTLNGRLALSFPSHRDQAGREHPYIRPLDNENRGAIEAQIFAALGLEGDTGP